ncbi:MAG: hypothetical protein ACLRFI_01680 [Alphaproteobacteria bacterium]
MSKKILLLLFLSACGFSPMFNGNNTSIYVAPISGINGIELRNALNARFGVANEATAKYRLSITLDNPLTKYKALETTGVATWQEIAISASYNLSENEKIIASGKESASESYTFVRYLVASNASYNNAVSNTINELAEKIGTRTIAEIQKLEIKSTEK